MIVTITENIDVSTRNRASIVYVNDLRAYCARTSENPERNAPINGEYSYTMENIHVLENVCFNYFTLE